MSAQLFRLVVQRADEITGTGPVISRKIVPAYTYESGGKTWVTTSSKVAAYHQLLVDIKLRKMI